MLKKISDIIYPYIEEHDLQERCYILEIELSEFRKKRCLLVLFIAPLILALSYYDYRFFVLFLVFYKVPYVKLCNKNRLQIEQIKYEFPLWLRQVQGLLQTNTVYNALVISRSFAPALIKAELEVLISQLNRNPLDQTIYESFMSKYEIYEIKKAMRNLFRMNFMTPSEISTLIEDDRLYQHRSLSKARINKLKKNITSLMYLNFLPMISVSFLFIYMMKFVFQAMLQGGV